MERKTKFTDSARYKCLEYLQKRTVDLYLSYCGIEECDPGHFYGPTTRTEYLIHYIIKGKGTYEVNDKTYHLKSHQMFLICPGVTTYYVADINDPWQYIWIGFNGIRAKTYLEWANLDEDHLICDYDKPEILFGYVKEILNARELTYANELKREGSLLMFLSEIIKSQHEKCLPGNVHDYPYQVYVDHALEFIEHNYSKGIRVSDIATYIGINRSYLTSIFKKSLNVSVQEYLVNYRLNKAAAMLKNTDIPIGNIARSVGYDDSLTFSKIFKSFKHVSPSAYRLIKDDASIENSNKRIENNLLSKK